MVEDVVIRTLLFPLSLLYGAAVSVRNALYHLGVLKSVRFSIPVISVGNLTVGGTGKSPHVEYLLRWLDQYLMVALLSRGYGRKTEGYRSVSVIDTALEVGDEPLQIKRKFPHIPVSVCESRVLGIPELVRRNPEVQCILLDDAFQHLAVVPGLNILLTEYSRPFTRDWLLPAGRLRESRSAYRRADLIIVTKCPPELTEEQRIGLIQEIEPLPRQRIFFSRYHYEEPYDFLRPDVRVPLSGAMDVLLVSAIAHTDYLMSYLNQQVCSVYAFEFADHHYFSEIDVEDIRKRFEALPSTNKVLLTTEKDATRLEPYQEYFWKHQLPILVLPVRVVFDRDDEIGFQDEVKRFLLEFRA
ncbi:MAG: tetraacyldisaccharide 4'-kinase [Saprospiraceae bacterium]|nr:tetraacyldisaccharide 4'-kinase [Saprospiraceae bacterium]MDW8483168.1 tetraacyldisaccharide 4'-kinase [Saprospiraceae bacterium]